MANQEHVSHSLFPDDKFLQRAKNFFFNQILIYLLRCHNSFENVILCSVHWISPIKPETHSKELKSTFQLSDGLLRSLLMTYASLTRNWSTSVKAVRQPKRTWHG